MSLALLGLLTIVSVLAAIMSRRVTPLVALIALPVLAALIGGFGLRTAAFAVAIRCHDVNILLREGSRPPEVPTQSSDSTLATA